MSSYQDEFEELEGFIYGFDQSLDGSNEINSWGRNEMSFFDDFVQEEDGRQFPSTLEDVQESEGLSSETFRVLNNVHHLSEVSSNPFDMSSSFGPAPQSNSLRRLAIGTPYQTGFQDMNLRPQSNAHPYRPEYQTGRPRPLPEPMFRSTELPDSSVGLPSEQNPYQTGSQVAAQTSRRVIASTIVESHESYNIHDAQALYDFPPMYTDNSALKREASGTVSRGLSEITAEGDQTIENFAMKRRRSSKDKVTNVDHSNGDSRRKRQRLRIASGEDEKTEWEDANRPKYARKIVNENARYRHALRLSRAEPSYPKGVRRLFKHLKSEIVPKKAYYRKKGSNITASHQPIPPTASTVLSETGGARTSNRKTRPSNPRGHIPVETVREAVPEGWDPYDNEYYSGDDNVSDGEIETRGKATDYKPPRMACRRCNKLKQPCDHAYPACSLCAKYGERCRYRDDLTGRQIRPGQLEEVEVALYDAQNEIKRLQEKLKKLEEAHNPRDDAQD